MSLSGFIAKTGQSPGFIAFMAHAGVAAFLLSLVHWHQGAVGIVFLLVAMVKEFWFDVHYELNQDYADGLQDWSGYLAGVVVALIASGAGL